MLFPPNLFVIFIIDLLKNLIYFIHSIYFLTKKLPSTIHKLHFFDLIIVIWLLENGRYIRIIQKLHNIIKPERTICTKITVFTV